MRLLLQQHKFILIAALSFIGCGLAALTLDLPLLLLIPFALLLLPKIFHWIITQPAQLFWLMLCCLPLSTEINLTPSLGIDFPDEILLMLLTGLYCIKLLHQPSFFPIAVLRQPLFLLLLLHFSWILLTCVFSVNPGLSIKFWLAKIWYIVPLVLLSQQLLNTPQKINYAATLLLWPMALVAVYVLIRHAIDGFTFEGIRDIMKPFFRNHVNYSAMLVCLLPAAIMGYQISSKKTKPLFAATIITFLIAIVFAYSRGAWVALIIGAMMAYIIKRKWLQQTIVTALVILSLTIGWLVTNNNYLRFAPDYESTIFHTDFKQHLAATTSFKDVSNAERFYRWVAGFNMVADKPIFGFGPNNFYDNYKPYAEGIFKTYVSDNPEHSSVHNYFLLTALEQGLPGLLLFATLYLGMLLACQHLYHQFQDRFYRKLAMVIGISLTMIGTLNLMSDLMETDKIGGLFWLALGLIFVLQQKLTTEKSYIAA